MSPLGKACQFEHRDHSSDSSHGVESFLWEHVVVVVVVFAKLIAQGPQNPAAAGTCMFDHATSH